jgi:hypothetical protein
VQDDGNRAYKEQLSKEFKRTIDRSPSPFFCVFIFGGYCTREEEVLIGADRQVEIKTRRGWEEPCIDGNKFQDKWEREMCSRMAECVLFVFISFFFIRWQICLGGKLGLLRDAW